MEDLVSRGHRYQDVIDLYPVALVLNFQRASRLNRRLLVADLAVGVSLGIRDALAKEGKLVQNWLVETETLNPTGETSNPSPSPNPLTPWLNQMPVVKRKRHG